MNNENSNSGQQNINPAWQGILDVLPTELHNLVIPQLKAWDQGVQQKFQEIHSQYEEYKGYEDFIKSNIDPEYAKAAVHMADLLQRDPAKLASQINETYKLGFVPKDEVEKLTQQSLGNDSGDGQGFFENEDDILKHPVVKQMYDRLQELDSTVKTQQQLEEEEREAKELEEYLNGLESECKEKNLPFDRTFVLAYMSQGIDGEDALKQYHQVLAVNANTETPNEPPSGNGEAQPPVVMGGGGVVGAGVPDGSVNVGALSKNSLNSTVEQILAQQAQQSGQG